jgi:hypothetical protein
MAHKKHFSEKLEGRVKAAKKAATKSPVERGKDKAADFLRLFDARIDKTVDSVRLVGNMTDTNNYEYDVDYFKGRLDEVKEAIAAVEARLKFEVHRKKARELTRKAA